MLAKEGLRTDENAGVFLSGILVVAIVAIALVGVLAGLWKIDTLGLVLICAGVFIISMFVPNLYALIPGIILIAVGLLLWLEVIGIALPSWFAGTESSTELMA